MDAEQEQLERIHQEGYQSYCNNGGSLIIPFPKDSLEYMAFEGGWTQAQKRDNSPENHQPTSFASRYSEPPWERKSNIRPADSYNAYAIAKGKD